MKKNENKIIFLVVVFIVGILFFIGNKNDNNSLKIPNDTYSIIRIKTIYDIKASIDVRLKKELYKSEIEQLAYQIKDQLDKDYENIFINYYLPGMKVGNGVWATSHFTPNLNISMSSNFFDDSLEPEIIDYKKADIAFMKFKKKYNHVKIIGKWYEGNNFIIIFFKKNKKYYLTEININNPKINKPSELITKKVNRKQTFIIKNLLYPKDVDNVKLIGDYTDYYKIEKNGDLSLYDKYGIIERYDKLN